MPTPTSPSPSSPVSPSSPTLAPTAPAPFTTSPTLAVDEAVRARRAAGQRVLHLGFGEAGLPPAPGLTEVLARSARQNGYGPVAGSAEARTAAAGWFTRREVPTDPEQVLFAPGCKPLLFALLAAVEGDVVVPCPAWVSYAAQATLLGRRVIPVPIPREAGGVPDPSRLEDALRRARADGARPAVLVLTVPDNPTGTVAPAPLLTAVGTIAERHDLTVISDETYTELGHRGAVPSTLPLLPERTVVTTGLSKSLALGGWRIGFARTPDTPWGRRLHRRVTGVASEIWSSLAAPMQEVAAHALDDPPELTAHIAASRRLHARVAAAVHARFLAAGAHCRRPQAGYYLYPDFAPLRDTLAVHGITTGPALAAALLDHHGVAALPGSAFGAPESALTLRIATSLLYGTTSDERRTALTSQTPETLPWVASALTRLSDALTRLADPASPRATTASPASAPGASPARPTSTAPAPST